MTMHLHCFCTQDGGSWIKRALADTLEAKLLIRSNVLGGCNQLSQVAQGRTIRYETVDRKQGTSDYFDLDLETLGRDQEHSGLKYILSIWHRPNFGTFKTYEGDRL